MRSLHRINRVWRVSRVWGLALAGGGMAFGLWPSDASAQVIGTAAKPIPDVLLLIDTSGSMERMPDNSMPSSNAASTCVPGQQSTPNRWGMLLQALTGAFNPYYSCEAIDRRAAAAP